MPSIESHMKSAFRACINNLGVCGGSSEVGNGIARTFLGASLESVVVEIGRFLKPMWVCDKGRAMANSSTGDTGALAGGSMNESGHGTFRLTTSFKPSEKWVKRGTFFWRSRLETDFISAPISSSRLASVRIVIHQSPKSAQVEVYCLGGFQIMTKFHHGQNFWCEVVSYCLVCFRILIKQNLGQAAEQMIIASQVNVLNFKISQTAFQKPVRTLHGNSLKHSLLIQNKI